MGDDKNQTETEFITADEIFNMREYLEFGNRFYGLTDNGSSNEIIKRKGHTFPTACNHEYKQYTGLVESYKYCIHCDAKA